MTRYVVLKVATQIVTATPDDEEEREVPVNGEFKFVGHADATDDRAAIRAVAKETGDDMVHGAVAVPVRNWRPRKPERKVTETTLWK